ncbi:MAG: SDR family NAD(P)-dependent oxidoreductase, partial [Polyangiales bacterium]
MKSFENKVAAITGARSGNGRALAVELGRQKCDVALSDVNEQGLLETVEQVRGLGVHVTSRRVDVADREAVHAWADEVVDEHGKANLIFNNAGVALASTVEGMSYGVSASSVHPGGIKTGIARSSRIDSSVRDLGISDIDSRERFEKTFITGADKAARVILDGVRR